MKSISRIFDPLMAMFSIDYEKRLTRMLQLDLYEAKKQYIMAIQAKQRYDTELTHAETRVNTLTELLNKQKETENGENSLSPTITVTPTYAPSVRSGV
jgi:exonuclease VII small subunit